MLTARTSGSLRPASGSARGRHLWQPHLHAREAASQAARVAGNASCWLSSHGAPTWQHQVHPASCSAAPLTSARTMLHHAAVPRDEAQELVQRQAVGGPALPCPYCQHWLRHQQRRAEQASFRLPNCRMQPASQRCMLSACPASIRWCARASSNFRRRRRLWEGRRRGGGPTSSSSSSSITPSRSSSESLSMWSSPGPRRAIGRESVDLVGKDRAHTASALKS